MSRVALVTGAGSGVGRAISQALITAGWTVTLAGRHPDTLAQTAASASEPSEAVVVPADVAEENSVRALFSAIEERFGRLDLLVNNAGTFGPTAPIDEVSLADWQNTVAVNLTGSWLCARSAFALMKRQRPRGGRIINNGSLSAHVPRPESAAYTATKHAVTGLSKSRSLDGRAYDIACGQIDIGNAATSMTAHAQVGMRQADGRLAPEPTMDVRHVADAVVYMAGLPLDANVEFLTVMATAMPYVGRG
jgi:NAD(P)-dependent dehydrogenase (short-subunit alcohol dehydrogenase family)